MSKRLSQFEDFAAFRRFTGADYLADKNLVAYAGDRLMLRSLSGGGEEQITAGGRGEGNPRFRPDGGKLLFVSSTQAGRQIYTYDLASKQVRQVTSMKTPVLDPIWSPDGSKILFASPSGGGGQPARAHSDEAVVIENFNYKFDGSGFHTPDSHMHLYIADAETGETVRVTEGDFDYMHHNWSADGKSVICCSGRFRPKSESIGMDLLLIRAEERGEVTRLTQDLWIVSYPNPLRPVATPDGKYIITGCLNMPKTLPDMERLTYPEVYLYRIAVDGSGYERIFQPSGECYQCVQFPYNAFCGWGFDKLQLADGGESVLFLAGWQGECRLYRLPVSGGCAQTLVSGKQAINGISRVQDGRALLALSGPTRPEWYEVLDLAAGSRTDTGIQSCPGLLADTVAYSQPEDIYIDTLDGDSRVHGWVMPPQNLDPAKKYPAILYVHGGPQPFYTYGFTLEHQCFAGAGFAVITCNARGSSSYGWNHQDIEKAYDGRAYMDLLQIVEEACRRFPWIDRDRIGVTGGSYGGYMVNYMAAHCKRFKAYITQRSISNELISYASSDMQGSSKGYSSFEAFMVSKLKASPVSYAERIDRPLLILHGMDDLRTPVEGAHQLFVAVKDTHPDLPVRMVLYPHLAHDQPSHPRQRLHYYREMVEWFQKYL